MRISIIFNTALCMNIRSLVSLLFSIDLAHMCSSTGSCPYIMCRMLFLTVNFLYSILSNSNQNCIQLLSCQLCGAVDNHLFFSTCKLYRRDGVLLELYSTSFGLKMSAMYMYFICLNELKFMSVHFPKLITNQLIISLSNLYEKSIISTPTSSLLRAIEEKL